MKRVAGLSFLLILVAGFVFADDANVLPQGVIRIRAIPSFSMVDQGYDKDGTAFNDTKGSVTVLSAAAELGVTQNITIGFQWAPGYAVASNFDRLPNQLVPLASAAGVKADKMSVNGPADLQVGAKFQIIGKEGFVANEQFRFTVTPGIQIPLDSYDAQTEATNALSGKTFRPASASTYQSLGLGSKADLDYVINEMFYVNLHGELLYFSPKDMITFGTAFLHGYLVSAAGQAYADANEPLTSTSITYGLQSTFELEPHAKFDITKDTNISAGLPLTFETKGAGSSTYSGTKTDGDADTLLSIGPNVSLFTLIGPLPIEVELQYFYPLIAKTDTPQKTFAIQMKFFGKLF